MNAEAMQTLVKKHIFASSCAGVIFLTLVAYFFRSDAPEENSQILTQKTAEARRLRQNVANSAQLKEHLEAVEGVLATIDRRLAIPDDLAGNKGYFYKLQAETGMELRSLSPASAASKSAAKGNYSSVPFTCSVQGTYSQLLGFLRKVEKGERYVVITNAALTEASGSGEEEKAKAPGEPALSLALTLEFLGKP